MKKASAWILPSITASILFLLAACATVPYAARPDNVMRVIDQFNAGNSTSLAASTQLPFLFNGEIIELSSDAETMWSNLVKSGIKITGAKIIQDVPATPETYALFADSMEVKAFFGKYLPKGTMYVRVSFDGGSFAMLLDGAKKGYPVIVGIKGGPV